MTGRRGLAAAVAAVSLLAAGCGGGSDDAAGRSTTTVPTTTTTTTTVVGAEVAGTTLTGDAALLGPVRTVSIDGITMSYRRFGTGPDLLLIAGQASPMSVWPLSWLRQIAAKHRVTIYDNRGLGLTTDDVSKPLRLTQLADDAAALLTAIGPTPTDVLGWSTGAEIGLLLAANHPSAVHKLITTGASLGGPGTVEGAPADLALIEAPDPSPADLLSVLFPPGHQDAIDRFVADIVAVPQTVVSPETTQRYADAENAYIDDPALPALWKRIKAPVLVHNGELDRLVPAVNAEQLAAVIPSATVVITPHAGHAAIIQEAATLLPRFDEFLG